MESTRIRIGSPPPMRGKADLSQLFSGFRRITPAYAGKRSFRCSAMHRRRDHPRLCGEKHIGKKHITAFQGSPPPMRGKATTGGLLPVAARGSPPPMRGKASPAPMVKGISRITPAYAGKSRKSSAATANKQDHPRLCGEKSPTFSMEPVNSGSPPPMRGKVFFTTNRGTKFRITPAYAGKRSQMAAVLCISWDHPRLCGEKQN